MKDPELIVLSHLRWTGVWQRPQHLISRIGRDRRTWFVEEPEGADVRSPRLGGADHDGITRVWLDIPDPGHYVGFDHSVVPDYVEQLPELFGSPSDDRVVWLYTPLMLEAALALDPTVLVYDVMDDLASFKYASPEMILRQQRALRRAHVVFTGGRSLHRGVVEHRRADTHLFPSGVEPEHYEGGREFDRQGDRRVAGYVGVIDERLDLPLIDHLARLLPEWEIQMVGPSIKLDDAHLPDAPNITYLGPQPYARLPELMGGFDVALMPFALNEATRSISPTKTLEYLAAGLPVVSTRVPDVVADYANVVDLQDDATGFAAACRRVCEHALEARDRKLRPLFYEHHWNTIAARMTALIEEARDDAQAVAAEGIA